MPVDENGVVLNSHRNPPKKFVLDQKDSMLINEVDWKWDDSIKELVAFVKGKIDLQKVTDSYADQAGVKNILAMMAQGDFSMVRPPVNLGDISGAPESIHEAAAANEVAKAAAAALDSLGLKDADGNPIKAAKLSEKEAKEIGDIVQSYLNGLTEGAKDNGHE